MLEISGEDGRQIAVRHVERKYVWTFSYGHALDGRRILLKPSCVAAESGSTALVPTGDHVRSFAEAEARRRNMID